MTSFPIGSRFRFGSKVLGTKETIWRVVPPPNWALDKNFGSWFPGKVWAVADCPLSKKNWPDGPYWFDPVVRGARMKPMECPMRERVDRSKRGEVQ